MALLWIDATYVKARRRGRPVVSVAVIIAVGVNADGRREVLGMESAVGGRDLPDEFLRKLTRRGLRGVELVISDAHEGLKAAVAEVLNATWQRCRALSGAMRWPTPARAVAAWFRPSSPPPSPRMMPMPPDPVAQSGRPAAADDPQARRVYGRSRTDVLAYMTFPKEHWTKTHSVNPLERLNGEVERRTNVVGIFPNEDAITRLVGAILPADAEWAVQRARYLTLETIAPSSDYPTVTLPTLADSFRPDAGDHGERRATPLPGTRSFCASLILSRHPAG